MREPIETLISTYQQSLFRVAFSILQNAADADDAVQETFIKYHQQKPDLESKEHIRSWLFRVTINKAKDIRRLSFFKKRVPLDEFIDTLAFEEKEDRTLFESVMQLPEKYRVVLQLYYYEGYSTAEIAEILRIRTDNVKARLSRARKQLKEMLKDGEL